MEALLPGLLGPAFAQLDAPLRRVHGGNGGEWTGSAIVRRGSGMLARIACTLAALPRTGCYSWFRMRIECDGSEERWIRLYGDEPVLVSRMAIVQGRPVDRLGQTQVHYHIQVRDGALHCSSVHARVLGVPLPAWLLNVTARLAAERGRYRFVVSVRLGRIGQLIHYEGWLDVAMA